MTDKIIIDGVDVSGCEYLLPTGYCKVQLNFQKCDDKKPYGNQLECQMCNNCYYKQLARKTEECEKQRTIIDYYIKKQTQLLDELQCKGERQFLIEQESISKFTYICELEEKLEDERQKVRELEAFKAELSKPITFLDPEPEIINLTEKYKQALGEIKENVTKMKTLSENDCGELTECFFKDRNCDKCSEDKCLVYYFDKILQKCEVLDAR
ncbi:MAG: hypothetical protein NC408_04600 [Candidatus Gastranaerophilales bacterium]|nr:hypothetical protein [Candidatus Gastranaerophilales bacterium]MCM1072248.1 hypothetical protein [Bacteroides sp.]